ncbi:MAG: glycoside hydrolase family 5 protein [Clostridiales bacterium]|nr:glycoside hydrolase family 5 protein [Clostridiales bacterium]
MNKLCKKIISAIASVAVLLSVGVAGCSVEEGSKSQITDAMFLKAEGELIKTAEGDIVDLRGVNAGGLFVIEQWMNGFTQSYAEGSSIVARDSRTTTKVFLERFGEEKTKELWEIYRENWWSEADFQNCYDMGINVIRLPFSYMSVDFAAVTDLNNGGKNYDFSAITQFVEKAAEYGIYTILDLHGAYGSQNGQDHSGEVLNADEVDFYSNEQKISLTVKLWRALAEHFKDNPAVAGYDILNEPAEKNASGGTHSTEKRHWDVFDRIYDAIREVDQNHIVIFESCWEGKNLPHPTQYGWQNCMYSFHHYTGCTGQDRTEEHNDSMDNRIGDIKSKGFGIPLQMGEFTCYENFSQWKYTLNAFNKSGISWCSWTYKINNTWGNSGWGIVRIETSNREKVNAHLDSYEDIVEKFKKLRTTNEIKYCSFSNEELLFNVINKYATAGHLQDITDYWA